MDNEPNVIGGPLDGQYLKPFDDEFEEEDLTMFKFANENWNVYKWISLEKKWKFVGVLQKVLS